MAGFPQLREAAWLYAPSDPWAPLAVARLFEHRDGSGRWEIRLNDPASAPTQTAVFDGEEADKDARRELDRLYEQGRADGEWRIREVEPY